MEAGDQYNENSIYPSIFKLLARLTEVSAVASYVGWAPINIGIIENSVKGNFYSPVTHESWWLRWWLKFRHWIGYPAYDEYVVSKVVGYISNPDSKDLKLLFIHLTDVDEYGHAHGFGSLNYFNQIKAKTDAQIAKILAAIDQAGWRDDSLVIMTTDHGGIGYGHGGDTTQEVNVFFAVRGPGITEGLEIERKVRNMDCSAIILMALGVAVPEWFDAQVPAELY